MKKILVASAFCIILLTLAGCGAQSTTTPTSEIISGGDYTTPAPPVNTDGAETKAIPGGMYVLGSSTLDTMAQPQEQPEHKVFLTGFNIYTHEVTNAMYNACVAAGKCLAVGGLRPDLVEYTENGDHAEYPVVGVDWFMAKTYCEWAGGRLPTEAEWEAAARGTDARIYPWGNEPATCAFNNMKGCNMTELPAQVGQYAVGNSPFEVWDMAGNVWEWTNDWFDANYYVTDPSTDPVGPWSGDFKVIRGGGWNSPIDKVRSANRFAIEPDFSFKDIGFRCVANELPVAPNFTIPDERHTRRGGDGRSVEEEPGSPSLELRFHLYGTPRAVCGRGDSIIFSVTARNSIGATYAADIDGNTMSCRYSAGNLVCSAPRRPAGTAYLGRMVYQVNLHMLDSSGTRLPDAEYGTYFQFPNTHFSGCGASEVTSVTHRESAMCATTGSTRLIVTSVSPDIRVSQILLNDVLLSGCMPTEGGIFVCPVPDSVAVGTAILHVVGTLMDGVQPVDYTGSVTIPDCTTGSTVPSLTITPTCYRSSSRFSFDYSALLAAGYYVYEIRDGTGVPITGCVNSGGTTVYCPSPAPGADGNASVIMIIRSSTTPFTEAAPQTFIFRPATCEGGDRSSGDHPLTLISGSCSPTGRGYEAVVSSLGLVVGVDYVSINTRTGGVDAPCRPDPANPAHWSCHVSSPVPADLQFCYIMASGLTQCTSFDHARFVAAMPTRCGGTPGSDSWSLSVGCENHTSDDNLIVNVGLVGGAAPVDMKGGYRTTTWYGTPNPGMPGFFQMTVPRSFITADLIFTAMFGDGSVLEHTENLASIAPATCTLEGGTGPGIGGLCADIRSASGWQNPTNQYDVNNDGCVTPIDVLLVITYLNNHPGVPALLSPRPAGSAFIDVSGDGSATPLDVLMVINYINSHMGTPCTSTCAPDGPGTSGEWGITVVCAGGPNWLRLTFATPPECGTNPNLVFSGGGSLLSDCVAGHKEMPGHTPVDILGGSDCIFDRPVSATAITATCSSAPGSPSHTFTEYPSLIPSVEECSGNTPSSGWSFTPPNCVEGGGSIEFNVDHPSELNIASASGQNLSTTYDCGIVNPTRLYCIGRVSTSLATLTIHYTLADGTTGSVDFGTIAAVTPAYCPTPIPAHIETCEEQTTQANCEAALDGVCKWSGTNCYLP